ncbi:hypothetical protein KTC96_21810 [Clostridium estertheticum]|uniref:hypothetical protein n=1 Tax=Clostridium estertheticum TaxID=238834 RepID=UPI001C7CA9BB|nr:hypothetical protein [Clostridium estertheticum]MBX4260709.1 hypothetical protein [Clostridium estertheticum]WLC70421.1 hypothetical protein KTC96_21810 [Clostridium estertheticum]
MKKKVMKLSLISLTSVLTIVLILVEILATTGNFKWLSWYEPENGFAMLILLLNPVTWAIVISVLCMNFFIKEMKLSGKLLLASIGTYALFLYIYNYIGVHFTNTMSAPNVSTTLDAISIVAIVIYVALIIEILVTTIKAFSKVVKGNN